MLSFGKLRKMGFGGMSEVALGKEFVRAFQQKLVDVKVTNIARPALDANLATSLLEAFEEQRLSRAIVVKTRDEANLPARLGLAAAHDLSDRLDSGERVGVGAGQSISWMTRYVRDFLAIGANELTFVSLTGIFCLRQRGRGTSEKSLLRNSSGSEGEGANFLVDADVNAIRMAQAVRSRVEFVLVGSPAVGQPEHRWNALSRNTWMAAGNHPAPRLDRALVGVGVLHDNWRLLDAINARDPHHPVRKDLDELKGICQRGAKDAGDNHLWWPVFDVANHLMLTAPRDGHRLTDADAKRAAELVKRLNQRFLTVRRSHLDDTKLYAVAGGRRKSYAIYDALHAFDVHTLVTDERTARKLLEIREAAGN